MATLKEKYDIVTKGTEKPMSKERIAKKQIRNFFNTISGSLDFLVINQVKEKRHLNEAGMPVAKFKLSYEKPNSFGTIFNRYNDINDLTSTFGKFIAHCEVEDVKTTFDIEVTSEDKKQELIVIEVDPSQAFDKSNIIKGTERGSLFNQYPCIGFKKI